MMCDWRRAVLIVVVVLVCPTVQHLLNVRYVSTDSDHDGHSHPTGCSSSKRPPRVDRALREGVCRRGRFFFVKSPYSQRSESDPSFRKILQITFSDAEQHIFDITRDTSPFEGNVGSIRHVDYVRIDVDTIIFWHQ